MKFFHVIEDAQAILRSKGLFRQAKLFRRGRDIYASWGAGFVRLLGGGGTSLPNVSWLEVEGQGVDAPVGRAPKFTGPVDEAAA